MIYGTAEQRRDGFRCVPGHHPCVAMTERGGFGPGLNKNDRGEEEALGVTVQKRSYQRDPADLVVVAAHRRYRHALSQAMSLCV